MKKGFGILAATFVLVVMTGTAMAQQYVANPSFEADTTGWEVQAGGTESLVITTEQAHTGTHSAKVVVTALGGLEQLRQSGINLPPVPGFSYHLTYWVMLQCGSSMQLIHEFSDVVNGVWVQDDWYQSENYIPSDGQWHLVDRIFPATTAGAKALRLRQYSLGTYYYDDGYIKLEPTTPVQPASWGAIKHLFATLR